jgi:hypothetical protein
LAKANEKAMGSSPAKVENRALCFAGKLLTLWHRAIRERSLMTFQERRQRAALLRHHAEEARDRLGAAYQAKDYETALACLQEIDELKRELRSLKRAASAQVQRSHAGNRPRLGSTAVLFGPVPLPKPDADEGRFDPAYSFAIADVQGMPADPDIRLRVQDRKEHARQAARLYALAENVTTATARSHVLAQADEHARLAGSVAAAADD